MLDLPPRIASPNAGPAVDERVQVTVRDVSRWKGRRVLVTGGAGFIGSALVRRLVDLDANVDVVDSFEPRSGGNMTNLAPVDGRIALHAFDLADRERLDPVVASAEVVFNLAGRTAHQDGMDLPLDDLHSNLTAQIVLLESVRHAGHRPHVVFTSTRQIYGRPERLPVDETHPLRPVDINGVNTVAAEGYHSIYTRLYGFPVKILRLTNTYGPGMRIADARQGFIGDWVRRLVDGEPIEIWGGTQRRDLCFVEDVVDALLHSDTLPLEDLQIYNVGAGDVLSLADLAALMIRVHGSGRSRTRPFPPERLKIDIGSYSTDFGRFSKTGWTPATGIEAGMQATLSYFAEHHAAYR